MAKEDAAFRLSIVLKELNITANHLARTLGMSRSEVLYQILRGTCGISQKVAESIVNCYPQFNIAWLMTGNGPRYSDPAMAQMFVPFYDVDLSLLGNIENIQPASYLYIPMVCGSEFAVTYHGEDMSPSIPNGTILVLSRISADAVVFGNEYVVSTLNLTALRRVRSADNGASFRLESENSERFDTITIRRNNIIGLYAVKAKIILKN